MKRSDQPVPPNHLRRWRAVLLLCGWFVATGAPWDILQVGAWARMWLENTRTESAAAALATTFSPEGMCEVCHAIQAAKHAQSDRSILPGSLMDKAPLLPVASQRVVIAAPGLSSCIVCVDSVAPLEFRAQPPVPPPRRQLV